MSHHHQTQARRSHRSHCTARNALPFRAHNCAAPPSTASHYNRAVNSPHFVGVDYWHAAKSFVRNSRASKRYQWQRERSQSQRFAVASGCPPARRWCLSGAVWLSRFCRPARPLSGPLSPILKNQQPPLFCHHWQSSVDPDWPHVVSQSFAISPPKGCPAPPPTAKSSTPRAPLFFKSQKK